MADNPFEQFLSGSSPAAPSGSPAATPAPPAKSDNPFDRFTSQSSSSDWTPHTSGSAAPQTEPHSWYHEAAVQPIEGLYSAADAVLNAPANAVNWATRQAGYEPYIKPKKFFTNFSTGEEPTTSVGRYGRSIGEQAGAMALPYVGGVARAAYGPAETMLGRMFSIPATGEAAAQHAASAIGAGVGSQGAQDLGFGETGQMIGALAGGIGGPAVGNLTANGAGLATNAVRYGTRSMNEAFRPELASDRDFIEQVRRSNPDAPVHESVRQIREGLIGVDRTALQGYGLTKEQIDDVIHRATFENPTNIAQDFQGARNAQGQPLTPQQIAQAVGPIRASPLKDFGLSEQQIAQILARRMQGETPQAIAADFSTFRDVNNRRITPSMIDWASQEFGRPTPMTPMDIAEELGKQRNNAGASVAMVRAARGAQNVARETLQPGMNLLQRQEEQGPRLVGMIDRLYPTTTPANVLQQAKDRLISFIDSLYHGSDYEHWKVRFSRQADAQAASDYRTLHGQPDVPIDAELAEILSSPEGASAYKVAMGDARAQKTPIPSRSELLKTFGFADSPGYGINEEGTTGVGLAPEAQHELRMRNLDKRIEKLENAEGEDTDPELLGILKRQRAGLARAWQTKSTGQYPPPGAEDATISARALDFFGRALRKHTQDWSNPQASTYNTWRQRLIDYLDPDPASLAPGEAPKLSGYRATMQRYRAGKAAEEALEMGASLKPALNEKTYDMLADFDNLSSAQKDLVRLRYARSIQDGLKSNKADAFAQFDNEASRYLIRRLYEPQTAESIIGAIQTARVTSQAEALGTQLAKNTSSVLADGPELQSFRMMASQQKDLVRNEFFRQMKMKVGRPEPGKDIVSQFNNPNTLAVIRELSPSETAANEFIRDLKREDISTNIKNGLYGNSTTPQQIRDASGLVEASRAAAHIGVFKWKAYLNDIGEILARQVGEERSKKLLGKLAQTGLPENIENLDRQLDLIAKGKEGPIGRELVSILKTKARTYWPAKAVMAGQIPLDLQRDAQRHQLERIEASTMSPEEKRDARQKALSDAFLH